MSFRVTADSLREGVIRRGIAGMQRDENIRGRHGVSSMALAVT